MTFLLEETFFLKKKSHNKCLFLNNCKMLKVYSKLLTILYAILYCNNIWMSNSFDVTKMQIQTTTKSPIEHSGTCIYRYLIWCIDQYILENACELISFVVLLSKQINLMVKHYNIFMLILTTEYKNDLNRIQGKWAKTLRKIWCYSFF